MKERDQSRLPAHRLRNACLNLILNLDVDMRHAYDPVQIDDDVTASPPGLPPQISFSIFKPFVHVALQSIRLRKRRPKWIDVSIRVIAWPLSFLLGFGVGLRRLLRLIAA